MSLKLIELENIRKHYMLNGHDVPILKGINLFVGQGEFVSIMGPSGSGKSTLSAILGCLSTPSSGVYKINGQDVTQLTSDKIARLRNSAIGFIFQDFNLLSGLTAVENVALPLVYGGMNAKARRERAMECLKQVGLEHKASNRPNQLSGGQKQRVAIARALVNHPKFLFADEPTGALDKKTGHEILGIMQRLNMLGHTVIQVTHSPQDANYSKRILHLVDGNIVRDELVEKPTIGASGITEPESSDQIVAKLWRVAQLAPSASAQDLPAIGKLIARSKTREAHVAAVRAIVRWSNHNIEPVLDSLFKSEDWVVRAEVVKYSNLRSHEKAIPYYVRALADENSWVRHAAIVELKDIGQGDLNSDQQAQVLKALQDPDERVRSTAIFIIGKWKLPNLRALILNAMHDPDGRVRANAVEAIQDLELQKSLMDDLIILSRDSHNRVRANATRIIAPHHPDIAANVILEMLNAPNPLTRSSGAWLTGMIKSEQCLDQLLELLKTEHEEVVLNQVVRSLSKLTRGPLPLHIQINKVIGEGIIP